MKHFALWLALVASALLIAPPPAHAALIRCNDDRGYFTPAAPAITGTFSGAGTTYSDTYEPRSLIGVGVQVTHTGTLAGTLTIESSNDGTNFYPVLGGSFTAITAAGGEQVEIGGLRSKYYRFKFVYGSGSGDLLVLLHFAEVGK